MLLKARRETVPARPRLRVPPVLRLGLCEPMRDPAASSSQQITEDPDAARRLTEHPRALSGQAAEDALADLWSAIYKAAAAQELWMAMEHDYMRRHYPGVLPEENIVGR